MLSTKTCLHASLFVLSCVLLTACGSAPQGTSSDSAAASGGEGQPQHIVDLVDQALVTARITGISMDSLALHVKSMSARELQVEIPAGTYFVAQNELVQNMVARHPTSFTLQPLEERDLQIDAACANVRRAEPGSTDTFGIVRASQQYQLQHIIDRLSTAGVTYPVEQAAIWIVTDDASYDDLGMLVGGSRYGEALIGENEAVRAMLLVTEAGQDITEYSIWSDIGTLRVDLTEVDLITWLDKQILASLPTTEESASPGTAPALPSADGKEISQWAVRASSESELTEEAGSAMQATGAPNTASCGDQPTAWASGGSNPGATLTLWFSEAVVPSRIVIYETYNPGAVFYVEVRDQYVSGGYDVYEANAALDPECPHQLVIDVKDIPGAVNMVEISVDQSYGWTQIDAVELIGNLP